MTADTGAGEPVELSDLRHIEVADVYKAGRLAGSLRRGRPDVSPDAVAFAYDAGYLADPRTPDVAFSLPKSAAPVVTQGGAVPAFFAGLLPEGVRLQAVSRAARASLDDHLTLLLVVGADAIGDVYVVPQGAIPVEQPTLFDPAQAGQADFREVFARAVSADDVDRVALPGIQVKVSSVMLSTPVATTGGPALLKLDPPDYPHLVANEHFFLAMAADCGIATPAHQILHDGSGRDGLLVERFDRVIGKAHETIRRLAQEDACQVMGRYPRREVPTQPSGRDPCAG